MMMKDKEQQTSTVNTILTGGGIMARYPKEATYRTFVIDSKTGKWKQIDPKDIPQEKIDELCDKFALGAGYKRAE
jgi:hypothetical protein